MSKCWRFAAIVASSGAVAFQVFGHREASAPPPTPQRRVQVTTEVAVKKKTPMSIESLGNVTTFSSVAIKPRIDDEIVGVHFIDGAEVKKGDLLITLDTRALDAQLRQAERRWPGTRLSLTALNGISADIRIWFREARHRKSTWTMQQPNRIRFARPSAPTRRQSRHCRCS